MVQSTQWQVGQGHDPGTLLLGIEGLAVAAVEGDADEGEGRLVHVVIEEVGAAACPACGVLSSSVKEHVTTRPRDVPYGPDPIRLVWHKTRWRCRETLCPRKTFTECLPTVPARSRLTTRLRAECGQLVADTDSCVPAAGLWYGVSWPIAHAAYVAYVQPVLEQPLPDVRVLGIDETRRGKPKWAQDADTGRWQMVADWWQTGIVDALGTGGMLAQVDGRTSSSVTGWLDTQPDSWKSSITHVAIDLSGSYLKAVRSALPDAVVAADLFHLVRLANDTLTKVRQEATRTVRGRRGRAKDPEWANRRKLLTGHERLSEPASTRCGTS